MNENHIHNLKIENFKSIKHASFDCKRVNIFIGKPNVGKSNILEALSLLSIHGSLKEVVRFNRAFELFYDNDSSINLKVYADKLSLLVRKNEKDLNYFNFFSNKRDLLQSEIENTNLDKINDKIHEIYNSGLSAIDKFSVSNTKDFENFSLSEYTSNPVETNIRKYQFKTLNDYNKGFYPFLSTPNGDNIWNILSNNKKLREEVSELFLEYGLEFLMNLKEEKFELQKRVGNLVYQYDYSLTADTLQRIIFHYAAIESNTNSVLLFEEPESHSYPGYIRDLAYKIAYSETNQFFIATHSPYLLGTLMENLSYEECGIFICSYKDYQTHIRELTQQEVEEAIDYGQDLFMNIDSFID